MNIFTIKLLIVLLILVSWAKAGLAGDWILHTVNILVLISLLSFFKSNEKVSFRFLIILPVVLLCLQFVLSYSNPSYDILKESEWSNLNIERFFTQETDIEKIIMTSEVFQDIKYISQQNPELAHAIFFDFKNRFFDRYPKDKGTVSKLILEYENLIKVNSNLYIPSSALSNKSLYTSFFHKICQVLIGIILFLNIKKRKTVRTIFLVISANIGILAFVGIIQKLNYVPSDNKLEIFGIWDTPEPRYFFSSFTYKNHWCAFALLGFCSSFGLLLDNYRRFGWLFTRKVSSLILFLTLLSILISIPLSGSRSGIFLMLISVTVCLTMIFTFFKIFSLKSLSIFLITFMTGIFLLHNLISKISSDTTKEMTNNFKIQFEDIKKGKPPLRILLWNDLLSQIKGKPIFGYGFNSYRIINPIYQSYEVRKIRRAGIQAAHQKYTPLVGFAHNDWLEKLSEFGIIGLVLACPYLYFIFRIFFKSNSLFAKFLLIGVIVFLLFAFVDFPSQTPACLMMFSTFVGAALKYAILTEKKLAMQLG